MRTVLQEVVHQAWQRGQQFGVVRRLGLELLQQLFRADLLDHPLFEEGLGGVPQIQLRVQVAAQTFDVEQGLLQQHQLRLDLHMETP
ncbi:hypothetical protein D9M69_669650 [compost metagenome]